MTRKLLTCSLTALLLACLSSAASAATLKADYRFNGTRASSVGTAPDLTDLTPSTGPNAFATETVDGSARRVLVFPQGNGLRGATAGVISQNAYSVVTLFRFEAISGYRRIIDFKNGTTDEGLYSREGRLNFYPLAEGAGAPIAPSAGGDPYHQVVLTRDGAGQVTGYVNGVQQFSFADTDGAAQISSDALRYFIDNDGGGANEEESAGAVARIRLYDGALSSAEVSGLDRIATATTPANRCDALGAITGTGSGETINGTAGDDVICALGGNDVVNGGGGNDQVFGGTGDDVLHGDNVGGQTEGGDRLFGQEGDDDLFGDGGNDSFDRDLDDPGQDDFDGGGGADRLFYNTRPVAEVINVFFDNSANDGTVDAGTAQTIERDNVRTSVENLTGHGGRDEFASSPADNTLNGGGGNDVLGSPSAPFGAGRDTLLGEEGQDGLFGGPDGDVLSGGAGADTTVLGGEGNDRLQGGTGADSLSGEAGNDTLFPGNDSVADQSSGGDGTDGVYYRDRSSSQPVQVSLDGSANDGRRPGGEGDNVSSTVENVFTGEGDDLLMGSSLPNSLDGSAGDDDITGDPPGPGGRDILYGRAGDDTLRSDGFGGGDRDYCGDGLDTYHADPFDFLRECEINATPAPS